MLVVLRVLLDRLPTVCIVPLSTEVFCFTEVQKLVYPSFGVNLKLLQFNLMKFLSSMCIKYKLGAPLTVQACALYLYSLQDLFVHAVTAELNN